MKNSAPPFIACGMYAFTSAQQAAWQRLFDCFCKILQLSPGQVDLRFEHGSEVLRQAGMWFGHTCGYPLISYQHAEFSPICVPLFDVPGTSGKLYCSRIIVNVDSPLQELQECRGRIAAMNNPDSNSGMNVLRHAVAGFHSGGAVFDKVITTGGHLASFESVADGSADVAAIDCVSYQLIVDAWPELAARVRVICDSVQTTGLPLVMTHEATVTNDIDTIVEALGLALQQSSPEVHDTLHLAGFAAVSMADYHNVSDVERYAVERGYPQLA